MDPFSITVGSLSLIKLCWSIGAYLVRLEQGVRKINNEIKALQSEINTLTSVNNSIQDIWTIDQRKATSKSPSDASHIDKVWKDIQTIQTDCKDCLTTLESLLEEIIGKTGSALVTGWRDGLKKKLRRNPKDADFGQLRARLISYQNTLQLCLATYQYWHSKGSQDSTDQSLESLSEKVSNSGFLLQNQLARTLANAGKPEDDIFFDCISTATEIAKSADINVHWHTKEEIDLGYVGRQQLLDDLLQFYLDASNDFKRSHETMRFVIHGLGGSGKTHFCCKFAQENRRRFWGVFFVDATSLETAKASFSEIAKLDNRKGDIRSAKDWLSAIKKPWLLVIDNADDPDFKIEPLFPISQHGFILITTRNPSLRTIGNIGVKHYGFENLGVEEANELLLSVSGQSEPWGVSIRAAARLIAEALGFLPLALYHAGKAILNNSRPTSEYLRDYEKEKEKFLKDFNKKDRQAYSRSDMNVFMTYEVLLGPLVLEAPILDSAKDAVELLKLFAFFYHQNISVEVLMEAAMNPRREREREQLEQNTGIPRDTPPWRVNISRQTLRKLSFMLHEFVFRDWTQPVLPVLFHDFDRQEADEDEIRYRLNKALVQLEQRSLLSIRSGPNAKDKVYTMHPLVHEWIRQRPQMTRGEQATFCEAATEILVRSIQLPPFGMGDHQDRFHTELLPHILHVRNQQIQIKNRIETMQKSRSRIRWFSPLGRYFGEKQARQSGKLGYVYLHGGYREDAAKHWLDVRNYLLPLGLDDERCRMVTLGLAKAYFLLSRTNEAAELQREALEACRVSLGDRHIVTLRLMDQYAMTLANQGRYKQALELHDEALSGMTNETGLGPNHVETLQAIDHRGVLLWSLFRYEEAAKEHLKALKGLQQPPPIGLGHRHECTLEARRNLALAYVELSRETRNHELLSDTHVMTKELHEQNQKVLGKEHTHTLMAAGILAQTMSELGQYEQAEVVFRTHIAIADRTIGENHFGNLGHGKLRLAQCLLRQQKFDDAEDLFVKVIEGHKEEADRRGDTSEHNPRGTHPDLIYFKFHLMDCYHLRGKYNQAISLCLELITILKDSTHPIKQRVLDKQEQLLANQNAYV